MPFCPNCGSALGDSARFCPGCGAPRAAVSGATPPPPPPPLSYACPQQSAPLQYPAPAQIVAVLPNARMMTSSGASDIYTIVFTPAQTLFAKLTGEIITSAAKRAQEDGKAAGKGWLGRASDQMKLRGKVHERYFQMSPAEILAETPGNFALDYAQTAYVGVKVVYEYSNQDVPADPFTEVEFASNAGVLKFRLRLQLKDVAAILNNFYPGRVRG